MKLTLFVIVALFLDVEAFDGNFYPPLLPRPKFIADIDIPAPIFLGVDKDSGCTCREVPEKFVVCYGLETCKKFPKNVLATPETLQIKGTSIENLERGDLSNWTQLSTLQIDANPILTHIEQGVFTNMTNLTNISISYCPNLKKLQENTFQGLFNLQSLYLIQNGFNDIKDIAFALKPSILLAIDKLVLSENLFRTILKDDFKSMEGSNLKELNLVLCQIEYIHPESLLPLTNLTKLRLGENSFNTSTITNVIQNCVQHKIPLKLLNLYSVGFRKSPPTQLLKTISTSNITSLCLSRNQFEVLKSSSFPFMQNLEVLDLREDLILNITKDAFSGMPKLRTLLLSGNKLSSVPEGVLLKQLTYLDLSSNSGNAFNPSYFSLGKDTFINMKNLQLLNLSFNRLTALRNHTFTGLNHLNVLGLKNATIFYIMEDSFRPLNNLVFLNLENNPFVRNHPLVKDIFRGLRKLQVLLLGGCLINTFAADAFEHLVSLKHLGLEQNFIHTLDPMSFQALVSLESINLSFNHLTSWHLEMFSHNNQLRKVFAAHNKLIYLSPAMFKDFEQLSSLDLTENPFSCVCASFEASKSFANFSEHLQAIQESPAFCVFPEEIKNVSLSSYLQDLENGHADCSEDARISFLYLVPLAIFLFVLILSAILLFVYRWHVRYWIFLARLSLSRRGLIKNTSNVKCYVNYQYDAFVSYSNEDRNFVIRLVGMLENYEPFLKLCVYERDFQIGSVISESILENIARSRKTILIISDSYARSQWCRWETQIAEHHRLFFENNYGEYVDDSLILIKLGPVNESHVTPTLKYLLKTRIYLQWDSDPKKQRQFWEKLRNALATSKSNDIRDHPV